MSWFSRLFTKASRTFESILYPYSFGQPVWTPRKYEDLAEEGYQQNSAAYSAIEKIAKNMAKIKPRLYRRRDDGEVEEVEAHPALELIRNPNPMQSGFDFREAWVSYLLISGNSYVHGPGPDGGPNAGQPIELWPLRPDKMEVVAGNWQDPISGYLYKDGRSIPLGVDEVMHAKLFNPLNAFYGMSPLEAAARSVDQHNAAGAWNTALLQNGGSPSAWINLRGNVSVEQRDKFQDEYKNRIAGSSNAGKPIVTRGGDGIDYHPMTMDAKELDWLEGKNMSAREIAVAFDVPTQLLGIKGEQTYANYEQATKALYTDAVLPHYGRFCDSLTRWLLPKFGAEDLFFGYETNEIDALQEDRNEKAERIVKLVEAGILTQKEAKQELGKDESNAEDVYILPMGKRMVPVGTTELEGETGFSDQEENARDPDFTKPRLRKLGGA